MSQVVENYVAAKEPGEHIAAGGPTSRQQAHEGKPIPHSKQSPSQHILLGVERMK